MARREQALHLKNSEDFREFTEKMLRNPINELQNVHELLTGKELLAANFRRKMMPYLTATDRITEGDGHRPAQIYTRNYVVED